MARNFVAASSMKLAVATSPVVNQPLTMACWFNPVSASVLYRFFTARNSAGSHFFHIGCDTTAHVIAGCAAGGTSATATTTTTFSAGAWAHACGVFTTTTSRDAYLNGGGVGSNTSSRGPTTDRIDIGANLTTGYTNGDIAECAIWNVALTAAEVAILATGVSPLRVRPASLVFYAPLVCGYAAEIELIGQRTLTHTNSPTVSAHPRVFMPKHRPLAG